jgi:hypothetical protein
MPSNNVSGAENQQERLKTIGWIVGFVDGEGCFTVSIFKNPRAQRKLGWQVFPEFVVSQGEKSLRTLEIIKDYFKCGSIIKNSRKDNHHEDMYKFCVRSLIDLNSKVIPFFVANKLKSAKQKDFLIFQKILEMINRKNHLNSRGLRSIASQALRMNRKKRPKFSEILRNQTPNPE